MSAKLTKDDYIQPFRVMMRPGDALIHLACLIFFSVAAVHRFGWLDGGMLIAALTILGPSPQKVPAHPLPTGSKDTP